MIRVALCVVIFGLLVIGCNRGLDRYAAKDIAKVTDFELSPDESKIAFSAITNLGNLDIWVVDIDGKNLKKLTFLDRSPTNHIAKFFKNHRWRNFYEIDMILPKWTIEGRISFCQKLSKSDIWGTRTVNLMFWTIDLDGKNKRPKTDKDKVVEEKPNPIYTVKISVLSSKYKKEIFLKYGTLWYLNYGETSSEKLLQ